MVKTYRDIVVWQRAVQLSVAIYRLTATFPLEERYGLSSQLRRAGVSVPSNIAEGYGRGTRKEYKQFLAMARGSTLEVQTQLVIARELSFCEPDQMAKAESLSEEVSRMLDTLVGKMDS
ncbi:MAG TPA: four helix bundle protein [Acidobacteriaceae bacterium]|jgi:four helix bundle protein|nr:four helix bundle protein [Acidobacteriaceae bacterium]